MRFRPALVVFAGALITAAPARVHAQSRGKVSLDSVQFSEALGVDLAASKQVARGLYTRDLLVGKGRAARRDDEIRVRYVGALADGRRFTAASDTVAFKLGAGMVIEGWDRGLTNMRIGGLRQVVVAPDLGYGSKQSGLIPPNSVLVFEVELLSIR